MSMSMGMSMGMCMGMSGPAIAWSRPDLNGAIPMPIPRSLRPRPRPSPSLSLSLCFCVGLSLAAACDVAHDPRSTVARGRGRDVVITAVPVLTREMASVYPFLKTELAAGGALEGKEVYAFLPSSVTAYEGDTLRLRLVNPEDDDHTFVLPDLSLQLPGQSTTQATWVARRAGIYPFYCVIPKHMPMMWGEVVVLRRP